MPHHRPHRRPVAVAVLLGVSLAVVAPGGTAWASSQLLPGASWSTTVDLPDAWADQADRLGISVATLDQRENECLRPEIRAGDVTCAADEGDLAGQVTAWIAAGRYDDDTCVTVTAPTALALLGGGVTRLAVTGPECLVLTLDFPNGADDDVAQSDTLAINLTLVAAGPGVGVEAGVPGGGASAGGEVVGGASPTGESEVGPSSTVQGGSAQLTSGQGSAGAVDSPAGTGERAADGADEALAPATAGIEGAAVGAATAEVEVGVDGAAVEAESAQTLLEDPFALGAMLLGLTLLLWALFLLLRRRRREAPA